MGNLHDIALGHVHELLGQNEEISRIRLKLCRQCGLYSATVVGAICDSSKYMNPQTGEISKEYKDGYVNGCGCRLNAKTRLMTTGCPLNKW